MYLEADAKMDTFQNSEGKNVTQLNLLQRRCYFFHPQPENEEGDDEGMKKIGGVKVKDKEERKNKDARR